MKKPQYTRSNKSQVPSFPEIDVIRHSTAIKHMCTDRAYLIKMLKDTKTLKRKESSAFIYLKRFANQEIKRATRLLKLAQKKLSRQPKPLDIFEYASPMCSPKVISIVRDSPEVIEYLQKAYADIQSSPFKGLFCWYVADVCQTSVFPLERDHLGQCNLRMHNKAWSYERALNRLFMQYPYRRFKPSTEHVIV